MDSSEFLMDFKFFCGNVYGGKIPPSVAKGCKSLLFRLRKGAAPAERLLNGPFRQPRTMLKDGEVEKVCLLGGAGSSAGHPAKCERANKDSPISLMPKQTLPRIGEFAWRKGER